MLGVTSVNRCAACEAVHDRWAAAAGLQIEAMSPAEAEAWGFGERLAVEGPSARAPRGFPVRHRRELVAAAVLIQLANLAGNRWARNRRLTGVAGAPDGLAPAGGPALQVADPGSARFLPPDALLERPSLEDLVFFHGRDLDMVCPEEASCCR